MIAANESASLKSSTQVSPFGPPLLLEGEDPEAYNSLLARIIDAIQPSDVIEEIWSHDIVELTREMLWLRRQKTSIMNEAIRSQIEQVIKYRIRRREPEANMFGGHVFKTKTNSRVASKLVGGWARKDPAATSRVEKLLAAAKTSMDTVGGRALEAKLNTIERIEHLITITEARRNAVIREIDRHRDFVAGMLQNGVQQIEDAEFTALETKEIPNQKNETAQDV